MRRGRNGKMHAKIGAKVLACMLYGQALFGLVAVAAVVIKDPQSPHENAQAQTIVLAALDQVTVK